MVQVEVASGRRRAWTPLQPTEAERRSMVAAGPDEVVVLWRQRGLSRSGDRFEGDVLALYQVRNQKLCRAQMFYFETAAVARFLANATGQAAVDRRPLAPLPCSGCRPSREPPYGVTTRRPLV